MRAPEALPDPDTAIECYKTKVRTQGRVGEFGTAGGNSASLAGTGGGDATCPHNHPADLRIERETASAPAQPPE